MSNIRSLLYLQMKKVLLISPFENILSIRQKKTNEQKISKQTKDKFRLEQITETISKPNYFQMNGSNVFRGFRGHGTIMFGKPIIEGNFFLSLKIRKSCTQLSAVRIGCCPLDFNVNQPLGCKGSIAYKSVDGGIVTQNKKIASFVSYGVDDVMKVELKIAPPHKYSNQYKVNYGSKIQFVKNGSIVAEWAPLYQTFYTLAISLFNYAEVQLLSEPQKGFLDWKQSEKQTILYKNAQLKRLMR